MFLRSNVRWHSKGSGHQLTEMFEIYNLYYMPAWYDTVQPNFERMTTQARSNFVNLRAGIMAVKLLLLHYVCSYF